jgi:hypothetical protein
MEIHVHHNGQQLGPFPKESLIEMARLGSFPNDALVWHDGATDWYPLGDFMKAHAPAAPQPAAQPLVTYTKKNDEPSGSMCVVKGIAAGFGVAVVGGGAWLAASLAAGFRIPFVGILLGLGVGFATSKASRGEGSVLLPVSAVVWTLLASLLVFNVSIWGLASMAYSLYLAWKWASD